MFNENCAYNDSNANKLTIEELRKYDGLKKLSDEEAIEIIDGLYKLAMINVEFYNNKKWD
ncbi:hypothetical protein [Lacinutrix sp. MedPE-SW]|uniref:hypothetical protein n=1 Tax=Lacinutrix sp. MedPE-SW TaxID=1860087 RepID=UPI000917A4EC|nr:hypothetical protein [Lacinutrix sp. MedPE-SW]OIQ21181.1 MAG: hypothetical protein BM549_09405 [Lacinutrix sp. MedPE-SW]